MYEGTDIVPVLDERIPKDLLQARLTTEFNARRLAVSTFLPEITNTDYYNFVPRISSNPATQVRKNSLVKHGMSFKQQDTLYA